MAVPGAIIHGVAGCEIGISATIAASDSSGPSAALVIASTAASISWLARGRPGPRLPVVGCAGCRRPAAVSAAYMLYVRRQMALKP